MSIKLIDLPPCVVVLQSYESEVGNEYVIRGNSALLKCDIPSYVADLVQVAAWLDDHGQTYHPTDTSSGKNKKTILIRKYFPSFSFFKNPMEREIVILDLHLQWRDWLFEFLIDLLFPR